MGTRSLTHIKDSDGTTLTTLYIQYDGYPSGVGKNLCDILAPLALVDGYSGDVPEANGMGCATAQIIAGLKKGVGNVYMYQPDSDNCGEEYVYTITPNGESFNILVCEAYSHKVLYLGSVKEYDGEKIENEDSGD